VRATVVVPTTASAAKVEALRHMDVELVLHGDDYEASERHALGLAERGAVFVSPYNDRHVIAGQSTVAAELVDQVGRDVTLVVPVGGGGLLAGIALGLAGEGATRIVGVEAAASPAVSFAVEAGHIATVPIGRTLADGLGGNLEPGAVTPDGARGRVHGFVHVEEDGIAEAIRVLATRCGLVAEGAAAVGVAALLAGKVPLAGPPVVVLTGRNIAPDLLARLLDGDGDRGGDGDGNRRGPGRGNANGAP
jgi:threonine dehydratase